MDYVNNNAKPMKFKKSPSIECRYFESSISRPISNTVNPYNTVGTYGSRVVNDNIQKRKSIGINDILDNSTRTFHTGTSNGLIREIMQDYEVNPDIYMKEENSDRASLVTTRQLSQSISKHSLTFSTRPFDITNKNSASCSRSFPKTSFRTTSTTKKYKYNNRRRQISTNGKFTKHPPNKVQQAENTTYCPPLNEMYNEEFFYKTIQRNARLRDLVRKLAVEREKEKQKEKWNSYINALKNKHGHNNNDPVNMSYYVPTDINTANFIRKHMEPNWLQSVSPQTLIDNYYEACNSVQPNDFYRNHRYYNSMPHQGRKQYYENDIFCYPISSQGRLRLLNNGVVPKHLKKYARTPILIKNSYSKRNMSYGKNRYSDDPNEYLSQDKDYETGTGSIIMMKDKKSRNLNKLRISTQKSRENTTKEISIKTTSRGNYDAGKLTHYPEFKELRNTTKKCECDYLQNVRKQSTNKYFSKSHVRRKLPYLEDEKVPSKRYCNTLVIPNLAKYEYCFHEDSNEAMLQNVPFFRNSLQNFNSSNITVHRVEGCCSKLYKPKSIKHKIKETGTLTIRCSCERIIDKYTNIEKNKCDCERFQDNPIYKRILNWRGNKENKVECYCKRLLDKPKIKAAISNKVECACKHTSIKKKEDLLKKTDDTEVECDCKPVLNIDGTKVECACKRTQSRCACKNTRILDDIKVECDCKRILKFDGTEVECACKRTQSKCACKSTRILDDTKVECDCKPIQEIDGTEVECACKRTQSQCACKSTRSLGDTKLECDCKRIQKIDGTEVECTCKRTKTECVCQRRRALDDTAVECDCKHILDIDGAEIECVCKLKESKCACRTINLKEKEERNVECNCKPIKNIGDTEVECDCKRILNIDGNEVECACKRTQSKCACKRPQILDGTELECDCKRILDIDGTKIECNCKHIQPDSVSRRTRVLDGTGVECDCKRILDIDGTEIECNCKHTQTECICKCTHELDSIKIECDCKRILDIDGTEVECDCKRTQSKCACKSTRILDKTRVKCDCKRIISNDGIEVECACERMQIKQSLSDTEIECNCKRIQAESVFRRTGVLGGTEVECDCERILDIAGTEIVCDCKRIQSECTGKCSRILDGTKIEYKRIIDIDGEVKSWKHILNIDGAEEECACIRAQNKCPCKRIQIICGTEVECPCNLQRLSGLNIIDRHKAQSKVIDDVGQYLQNNITNNNLIKKKEIMHISEKLQNEENEARLQKSVKVPLHNVVDNKRRLAEVIRDSKQIANVDSDLAGFKDGKRKQLWNKETKVQRPFQDQKSAMPVQGQNSNIARTSQNMQNYEQILKPCVCKATRDIESELVRVVQRTTAKPLQSLEDKLNHLIASFNSFVVEMRATECYRSNVKTSNTSSAFNQLNNPPRTGTIKTKSDSSGSKTTDQVFYTTVQYHTPINNVKAEVDANIRRLRRDLSNTKIENIIQEEMEKSKRIKRDIKELLHTRCDRQCSVEVSIDIPTKDVSTAVTASLSKTQNSPKLKVGIEEISTPMRSKDRSDHRMAIAVNTDPMGLLALMRVSAEAVKQLLSYMPQLTYNPYPRALLPLQRQRPDRYVCNICGASFCRPSQLSDHIQQNHDLGRTRDCCVCRHVIDMESNRAGYFKCKYCGKMFTRAYCCELHQQTCARLLGIQHDDAPNLMLLK